MEPKVERQASKNQDSKTAPQAAKLSSTNQQQASGDAGFSTLNRPWADREHTLNNKFQEKLWWEAKTHSGNSMERWRDQSMTDGPYQNIESIITKTKMKQSMLTDIQSSNYVRHVSETAATAGSKQIEPKNAGYRKEN
ncbi:hypothetical protein F4814DRAFT_443810 [Daldinia grandis]|nr:hypothetical protein F4814DRAFT_443810 [Daldinia grandis]